MTIGDPLQEARRTAHELRQTEYFDIMLLHWQHSRNLARPTASAGRTRFWRRSRGRRSVTHGASVHGLPALRQVPGNKWLEIAMIRMNHKGAHMDNENDDWDVPGNVSEVVTHVQQARAAGMGVISMKLVGEGASPTAATASRRCDSRSGMRASTASRWATRTRRRSTKPSTT